MSSNEREISPPKRRRVEVIELESDSGDGSAEGIGEGGRDGSSNHH